VRLSTILRLLIAVALTALILWRSDPAAIWAALSQTAWPWLAGACLLVVADRALMASRWIALLRPVGDTLPSGFTLARIFFVSTFVGTFLPPTVGSDAVRAWSLAREGTSGSGALASVLLDRLLGVISILLTAVLGLALLPDMLRETWVDIALAAAAIGCACALAVVFSTRLDDLLRRTLVRLPGRWHGPLDRVLDALQAYRGERTMLVQVLTASVIVQILRVAQAWMLGRSLGITLPLFSYLAAIPIILLVMLLPVAPAAIGTSQWAFMLAFRRFGVPDALSIALSVLFVALGVVGNLPGGLFYIFGRAPARPPATGAPPT